MVLIRLGSRIARGIIVLALCSRCLDGDGGGAYARLDCRVAGGLRGQFDTILLLSAACWRVGRLSAETGSCSVPDLLLLDRPKGDWRRVFVLGALPRLEAFAFLFFLLCLDMVL